MKAESIGTVYIGVKLPLGELSLRASLSDETSAKCPIHESLTFNSRSSMVGS